MSAVLGDAKRRLDDELLDALEELWATEAREPEPEPEPEPRAYPRRRSLYGQLVRTLVVGWPAVILFVGALAPAPAPDVVYPTWIVAASVALYLGPLLAGLVGAWNGVGGLGLSALLGATGIAVGIACRATSHHVGAWWMVETALFGAFAAASVAALVLRARL